MIHFNDIIIENDGLPKMSYQFLLADVWGHLFFKLLVTLIVLYSCTSILRIP